MSKPIRTPIETKWVIGAYKGARAKIIMAHASQGIGYIIVENFGNEILAAFRKAIDDIIPEHLTEVTDPFKIAKYEKIRSRI